MTTRRPKHLSMRRRLLFAALTSVLALALVEGVLQALCLVSTPVNRLLGGADDPHAPIADPLLGHRPNPDHPEHDARGFRNPAALDRAEIVALGDSQTYGTGVAADEAWPRRLAETSGRTVYSIAHGGWGPTQSLALLDEALSLEPRVVVEAFYAGNDLFDAFDMVYGRGAMDELATTDAALAAVLRDAEAAHPMAEEVLAIFSSAPRRGLRGMLSRHSKLWALLRAARDAARPQDDWSVELAAAERSGGRLVPFESSRARTIFTPRYRLRALDLDDPRLSEGLRICLEAIREMDERAKGAGARFVVLLIPTKEHAFLDEVARAGVTGGPEYDELAVHETAMWARTRQFLETHQIEFVDALPALRRVLETENAYPISEDGHPARSGHLAIAEAVRRAIEPPAPGGR